MEPRVFRLSMSKIFEKIRNTLNQNKKKNMNREMQIDVSASNQITLALLHVVLLLEVGLKDKFKK